jgi:tripartite-type tricarboxylate transporter receptor subunit TctC
MNRTRALITAAITVALTCLSVAGQAADIYPNRTIRLIVPYPPGGASDVVARLFANEMSKRLGQTMIVENKPGANGLIGSELVAKSAPDGYTLLSAVTSSQEVMPALRRKLPYDPIKSFAPVIKIGESIQTLVARTGLPASNVQQLIAYAKANPGKLNYGSPGIGSIGHFGGALFAMAAHIDIVHVPYKGDGPAMADVIANRLDLLVTPLARPAVQAGQVKVIGVAASHRSALVPDWPTIAESGIPYNLTSWVGVMAPAGTSPEIIKKLNTAGNEILQDPVIKKRYGDLGYDVVGGSPQEFGAAIIRDIDQFRTINKTLKISLD